MDEAQQAQEAFRQNREAQMLAENARQHHLEVERYNAALARQREEAEAQRRRENGGW